MAKNVVLEAKLDSDAAELLKDTLLKHQTDDISFDASAVEHLGGLCLEILMSAKYLWPVAGKSVKVTSPSLQMVEDLGRFGLTTDDLEGSPA